MSYDNATCYATVPWGCTERAETASVKNCVLHGELCSETAAQVLCPWGALGVISAQVEKKYRRSEALSNCGRVSDCSVARKKIISLARDFWGNPDALWDPFYILPAKRIISSIRGGCTTNFLLSYTHQRSGERFNKTLNGTKCWRKGAIITSEAFSLPSRKSFHYT